MKRVVLGLVLLSCFGCNPAPEPIVFGSDQCQFCKMSIVDNRYGAELVTAKGKIYKFDALECLVDFKQKEEKIAAAAHLELAVAFDTPGELVDLNVLHVLYSESLPSPMGMYLSCFKEESEMNKWLDAPNARSMQWAILEKDFEMLDKR